MPVTSPLSGSTRLMSAAAVGAVVLAAVGLARPGGGYDVTVALASATNVVAGGPVLVDGFSAGKVTGIDVRDGRAVISLDLDDDVAPLHDGAQVVVGWKATLSERQVEIVDGPDDNAEIPDGGMVTGTMPKPTEIDDVLNALDAPTRARVTRLVGRLDRVMSGNEEATRDTLSTTGPAVRELAQLLQALGTDGPAIKHLVTRMNTMLTVVARHDGDVQAVVDHLAALTRQVAGHREALQSTLRELPGTLDATQQALAAVPPAADQAVPLLRDLGPATASLKPVARHLAPVLRDLRPLTADLRPALGQLQTLLGTTPGLLSDTAATFPGLQSLLGSLREPAAFMRPYTPEATGFFSTWASAFANWDSNGNFARIAGQEGTTSFNENPGVVPPGVEYDPYPAPGAVVKQPWTDAAGSELR